MGCCSPFSAVSTAAATDPGRHVNFTSGMVLGVDDYRQEFAYHSARDQWIVREFLGYGTLSGLAVSVEATPEGARVRVTPGAAAAPSGQLICVGREQCGGLNAWLARAEVREKIRQLTDGSATPDEAILTLYLTLRYVDCAVAEVPIPGEPCRSDENLMAPSRIADDYALRFAFEPPPMAEALALPALDALLESLELNGATPNSAEAFADALRIAELRLQLVLGLYPEDAPEPAPADLGDIRINPAAEKRFRAALARLWVTRIRPQVAAQSCARPAVPANDCVLLAQLTVPVIKPGNDWVLAETPPGKETPVVLAETDRPILLSAAVAQTSFGATVIDTSPHLPVEVIPGAGFIGNHVRYAILRSDSDVQVTVPAAMGDTIGEQLTVKNSGAGTVTLAATAPTTIDGAAKMELPPGSAITLLSDGQLHWHLIGRLP
jgi:hypothetical protein